MTEADFTKKVNQYINMIYRISIAYLKNQTDAEDITQEVFVKILRCNKSFHSSDEEKAWIIRVTINACKDLLKSSWYKRTVPFDKDIIYTHEDESDVYYAVMELPLKYRSVIYFYYYEEYSIREIAQLYKQKETTIQVRIHRARKMLKKMLEEKTNINVRKDEVYDTGI